MIRLEAVTKRYPGQDRPAVEHIDLDIPDGEIVIFVGPSGCGKTTLMKMINRLIEPTAGRIFLQGQDVTRVNPDQLRRRIGYVIQQIGLFPHMTIGDNIATVPKMLGWDKTRIDKRIDELLELVGLEAKTFRSRYPKQLSGGQRQRVGVARALAVDPPVMLMDEPFGAIDPITRDRLQNEFLRLQAEIRKTIVFVTHDIDEAIKMGDRIAILREGATVAQYDTPRHILSAPADNFVADFVGAGASLKRLNLSRVRDVELTFWPTVATGTDPAEVLSVLRASDKGAVLILDERHRPVRWVTARDIDRTDVPLEQAGLEPEAIVEPQATLQDTLNLMLDSSHGAAVVVDGDGAYLGAVDFATVAHAVQAMRREAREQLRAAAGELSDAAPAAASGTS
ncbi:MAG: betaine/proline/choline family ABC transporter ATP-binding protein [Acidimicrobiia bacterium]|nr:betaine/proline/choline family ABC transporter ATP-binding protein [Acidimicrobiia bacterium]